jgi:hypothetical protein
MATHGEKTTRTTATGTTEEVFNVEFTNGAVKQLEELKKFFKASDLIEVIQLGISYLQKVKEVQGKAKPQEDEGKK